MSKNIDISNKLVTFVIFCLTNSFFLTVVSTIWKANQVCIFTLALFQFPLLRPLTTIHDFALVYISVQAWNNNLLSICNYCRIVIIGLYIKPCVFQVSVKCNMTANKVNFAGSTDMKKKVKCEYWAAGTKYLSNSTFHSLPWLTENLPFLLKVRYCEFLVYILHKC